MRERKPAIYNKHQAFCLISSGDGVSLIGMAASFLGWKFFLWTSTATFFDALGEGGLRIFRSLRDTGTHAHREAMRSKIVSGTSWWLIHQSGLNHVSPVVVKLYICSSHPKKRKARNGYPSLLYTGCKIYSHKKTSVAAKRTKWKSGKLSMAPCKRKIGEDFEIIFKAINPWLNGCGSEAIYESQTHEATIPLSSSWLHHVPVLFDVGKALDKICWNRLLLTLYSEEMLC